MVYHGHLQRFQRLVRLRKRRDVPPLLLRIHSLPHSLQPASEVVQRPANQTGISLRSMVSSGGSLVRAATRTTGCRSHGPRAALVQAGEEPRGDALVVWHLVKARPIGGPTARAQLEEMATSVDPGRLCASVPHMSAPRVTARAAHTGLQSLTRALTTCTLWSERLMGPP